MISFLPPSGSRIRLNTKTVERVYLITGYKDRNIALLHDLTTNQPSSIIMRFFRPSVYIPGYDVSFNPYITILD